MEAQEWVSGVAFPSYKRTNLGHFFICHHHSVTCVLGYEWLKLPKTGRHLPLVDLTSCTALCGIATAAVSSIDFSTYVRVGRYELPEPTRTVALLNSLLVQEASGMTCNRDTDTIFLIGAGSASVVQISKTGELIDSMTLALGTSPQGTSFYDTEGITYIGGGQFVIVEELYRQANLFTYARERL